MKLLRETLTNFKGIRDYTFSPEGGSVSVERVRVTVGRVSVTTIAALLA